MGNKPLICLAGPTAVGKTALTVELCHQLNAEVISADAVQVYRGMDIGSAKPSEEEQQGIPHHLVNIIDPTERYSVAAFVKDVMTLCKDIEQRGKRPIVSGGTMFYLQALRRGLDTMPQPDKKTLQQLDNDLEQFGLSYLYDELTRVDQESARKLNGSDTQRIMRALAVYRFSKTPISTFYRKSVGQLPTAVKIIALIPNNRKQLHKRIALRFQEMLEIGLVDEVEKLMHRYHLTGSEASMRAVGYRQVVEYLNESVTFEEMQRNGIAATRQLAKRQLTWIRNSPGLIFYRNPTLVGLKSVIDCL